MDKPILFSGPMVRAILEGRKTQTRRVVTIPRGYGPLQFDLEKAVADGNTWLGNVYLKVPVTHPQDGPDGRIVRVKPAWNLADRLWVRETWYNDIPDSKDIEHVYYRADGECCSQIPECACAEVGKLKWRPSIFMPKWACRLWLEVVSVRIERVKDLSEADARAEGVRLNSTTHWATEARDAYRALWDSLNAKRGFGWDKNPWVWVVEFKKLGATP